MDKYNDCAAAQDKPSPAQVTPASKVDLWQLSLDTPDPALPALSRLLSPDEVLRAGRFHFSKDRDRYQFVRASLRTILGEYLNMNPAHIEFCYGQAGKPCLPDSINSRGIRFNLSHSQGLALIAVAWNRDVGVDVEKIRTDFDLLQIASHFFSPSEVAELVDMPVEQQPVAFFNCWTRKEAYVKATGAGLSFPLHSFGVSLKSGQPARLTFVHDDTVDDRHWTLRDISPSATYAAALAVEGGGWELCLRNTISLDVSCTGTRVIE